MPRERMCSAGECEREVRAKGLCLMHYKRERKTGSVFGFLCKGRKPIDPLLRVMRQTQVIDECWIYEGYGPGRYGQIEIGSNYNGDKRRVPAHRVVYEALRGSIGVNLELDHQCLNTRCVNPDHLEPVSRSENVRRMVAIREMNRVGIPTS